jgi:hypothetical protein
MNNLNNKTTKEVLYHVYDNEDPGGFDLSEDHHK